MKMEYLKCRTPDGVMKELMIFALVYNLIRAAMVYAAARQGVTDANQISFTDTMRWLGTLLATPSPEITDRLILNPIRPGRWHPRVKKRRMKGFSLMNKPRSAYAQTASEEQIVS